jgi:hypothetical protein
MSDSAKDRKDGSIRSLLLPAYEAARACYSVLGGRATGLNISEADSISMGAPREERARELRTIIPNRVKWDSFELGRRDFQERFEGYLHRHSDLYRIDKGRGKALEHALGFELLDFTRVRRYCDVASCASRIQQAFPEHYPNVEFWTQDLMYEDDPGRRRLGGFAHRMAVPDGFFDAITLHNSFEHFAGDTDTQFVSEVDRVLSLCGACVILPLYLASTARIYFDPVAVTPRLLRKYDKSAELIPVPGFARQEHARCYDATTLKERIIDALPKCLAATIVEFSGGENLVPEMYPDFALVLHRERSVFRC